MDETYGNPGRMQETGCDHKTDAVEHTACTQRQFCPVRVPMSNGKEADNYCGDPQLRTRLAEHSEPQRQSRQRDAQFDPWELDPHQPHHAAERHDHWENYRQNPDRRSAKLRAPHPYRNHRQDMVPAGNRMLKAAHKPYRLTAPLVSKSRERIKQQKEPNERMDARVRKPGEL